MKRAGRLRRGILGAVGWLLLTGCGKAPLHDVPGLRQIFGRTGMGPIEFSYPRAMVRSGERFYIVDKAARIQCFEPSGDYVLEWRMPEFSAGKPTGLGAGPDGRIYAADTHYARVMVYEADGKFVASFGHKGNSPGEFNMPTDVALAPNGDIYVGEYGGNDRISRFTPRYEFVQSFGGPDSGEARLQRPQALAFDTAGELWVADAGNHRICRFSTDGRLEATFGQRGSGPGELSFPYGIDFLSDGTLVVAEYGNNRIQHFSRTGECLGIWGSAGRAPGQVAYPWAVAVGRDDVVWVLDSGNNRVQVIAGGDAATWHKP